jgi:S1-C subfamily serine protease
VAIDGKPIHNSEDLAKAIEGHKPGDTIAVTVVRDGKRQDVSVTL